MSYCRFGPDCDVYVYRTGNVYAVHTQTSAMVPGNGAAVYYSLPALRAGLLQLRAAGYRIPDRVFERIARERAEEGTA